MKALEFLKENNEKVYLVYILMLFSGVSLEHVIRALNSWSPDEVVYVDPQYLYSHVVLGEGSYAELTKGESIILVLSLKNTDLRELLSTMLKEGK